jgi:hypothetical protein
LRAQWPAAPPRAAPISRDRGGRDVVLPSLLLLARRHRAAVRRAYSARRPGASILTPSPSLRPFIAPPSPSFPLQPLVDLLHPDPKKEKRVNKKKRLVQVRH